MNRNSEWLRQNRTGIVETSGFEKRKREMERRQKFFFWNECFILDLLRSALHETKSISKQWQPTNEIALFPTQHRDKSINTYNKHEVFEAWFNPLTLCCR